MEALISVYLPNDTSDRFCYYNCYNPQENDTCIVFSYIYSNDFLLFFSWRFCQAGRAHTSHHSPHYLKATFSSQEYYDFPPPLSEEKIKIYTRKKSASASFSMRLLLGKPHFFFYTSSFPTPLPTSAKQ